MEQLGTLILDAIIKLRNNSKQPNENSVHTSIIKGLQIIKQKAIRGKIIDTHKESRIINRPTAGKKSYFTINNGLPTIESVKWIFKEQQVHW